MARSLADTCHQNRRVTFKSYVHEQFNKLDTKPGVTDRDNHPKHESKEVNDYVSSRTRSKASQSDQ
jgi:hypothetical protein